jgi:hypothetical protein
MEIMEHHFGLPSFPGEHIVHDDACDDFRPPQLAKPLCVIEMKPSPENCHGSAAHPYRPYK